MDEQSQPPKTSRPTGRDLPAPPGPEPAGHEQEDEPGYSEAGQSQYEEYDLGPGFGLPAPESDASPAGFDPPGHVSDPSWSRPTQPLRPQPSSGSWGSSPADEAPFLDTSEPFEGLTDRFDSGATGPYSDPPVPPGPRGDLKMIGLWGSPQSGKTTYLASLRHSTSLPRSDYGKWAIYPQNRFSANLMADLTDELLRGQFPNPTLHGALISLQWVFVGDLAKSRFARRKLFQRGPMESRFVLDLIDVSGMAFDHAAVREGSTNGAVANQALDHLTASDGLIYLFDPVGERDNRDSSRYVNGTITELRRRAAEGRRPAFNLNKQVSVCITKFDDPTVFQAARRNGFVNYGSDGMPHVLEKDAEAFFDLLCTNNFWGERYERGLASAQFVRNELKNLFGSENIKYFVTSSIGFYLKDGSTFDPDDFTNSRKIAGDRRGIRGAISPVNVLEPLISLQQRIERQ